MKVFLDIQIERTPVGRLICELRDDVCPKTSENFRRLCKGERVMMMSGFGHELRTYKNSVAHRIIPKFMCQMGDYENNDGTGGKSVYGEKFADENFVLKHSERGVLSMANSGKDTNGSQFFVCLEKCPWLDGKHCAFGKVVSGMDVLEKIEMCGSKTGKVSKAVKIIDCGEIDEELEFGVLGKTREASEREKIAIERKKFEEEMENDLAAKSAMRMKEEEEKDNLTNKNDDDFEEINLQVGPDLEKMSAKQRKLYELRQKMNIGRTLNHTAVLDEKKREDNPDDYAEQIRRKQAEALKLRREEEAKLKGVDPDNNPHNRFHQEKQALRYEQNVNDIKISESEYEDRKNGSMEFYRGADSLLYGTDKASKEGIEKLQKFMRERDEKRRKRNVAEKIKDSKGDGINDGNSKFNSKLDRHYGKYTKEIKANLERGTALPDN